MVGRSSARPHGFSASSTPSPTTAMEYSTTATPSTPSRPAMESKYSIPRSRRISSNELPLVHCEYCKSRFLKVLISKTPKNYDRPFYVCPTRTREGGGCPFWEWEEGYEQYLVDKKLVPPDYQPVFESTKLPQQVQSPILDNEPKFGEASPEEQLKQLREIARLLKWLIVVCVLVLFCNVYAIVRSG